MKKLISFMIVFAFVFSMVPAAFAAGSASLTGPSTVRAGDTITLSFSAGGGIYGGSGSVSFDSSQLTLKGYSQSVGGSWAVEFNGNNFVFYDNSMASPINGSTVIFTATFTVNSGLATGTGISVTASGITLSDGEQDMSAGSPTYSATIAAPLSNNCDLASLKVDNATIYPDFSADVTEYSASVPYEVSDLYLSAEADHPGAQVSVDNPTLVSNATTAVRITVTAETGATKTYVIYVSRDRDPNYVESSNANLGSLYVEGYDLSPAFDTDVKQYYVWLPYERESVDLYAEAEDELASVSVGSDYVLEPGRRADIPVTVTAEDGTEQVYIVTVVRAPAPEDVEKYLSCSHDLEPEPTEPVTEPATEPVTEPVTEPEPTEEPEPVPEEPSAPSLILIAILCALAGAAVGAGVVILVQKKKQSAPQTEEM